MQLSHVRAQWVALSLFLCLFSTVLSARSPAYVNDTPDGNNDGTSWEDAFTDLQSALDNTASGDIWVAAGTYKPSAYPAGCTDCATDRDFTFLLKDGVSLYGGFAGTETLLSDRDIAANPTTLSGDTGTVSDASDNVYHVVQAVFANTTPTTRLDGFTITVVGDNPANAVRFAPFTAPDDLCVNSETLTGLGNYNPTGGVYTGPGVTDDGNGMTYSFDPAAAMAGTHTVTYTVPHPQIGADIDGEAADDFSDYSVSLSSDGRRVAIGARDNDENGSNSGQVRLERQ